MASNEGDGGNRSVLQNGVTALTGIWNVLRNSAIFGQTSITVGVSTVAGLPNANDAGQGARRTVTDATATTFYSVVAGGGANVVPVFSDGTQWRIGG